MAEVSEVAEVLLGAESNVVFTGAGISKASGIPTYRDVDGLWRDIDARKWSNRRAFDADPSDWYEKFWQFYDMRSNAQPSAGHLALRDMVEASVVDSVVTQNIDSLDRKAGTSPSKILEVHGHDRSLSCTRVDECDFSISTEEWLTDHDTASLPTCPDDGEPLKPDIILFDDTKVPAHVADPWERAWGVISKADTLTVVGTTLTLITWAEAVGEFALKQRKPLIVINPNENYLDKYADHVVYEKAEEALPELRDRVTSA